MKVISIIFSITTVIVLSRAGAATAPLDIRAVWKDTPGVFAKAALEGAGFSFKYGGHAVGPEFSGEWQQTFADDKKSGTAKTVLTHASGLVVTREMRVFPGVNAVEYRISFKNSSKSTLSPVSEINALNLAFGEAVLYGNCVVSFGGGLANRILPSRSFAVRKNCFVPTVPEAGMVELGTEGGQSSNKDSPFFFIQNDSKQEGMFVAFGWSGQWTALAGVNIPREGILNVRAKIPGIEIALEPGEEIKGPTVLVGLYQGALTDGSNRLRRLIRDVYTPKLAGKRYLPVATYDTHWGTKSHFDEALLKKQADTAAALHQEYFLLDSGWYAGKKWMDSVGNWDLIHPSKLPNGMKPVADYVQSKGLKFGLWFEPERVALGTQLAKDHPDWILWENGNKPWVSRGAWMQDLYGKTHPEVFEQEYGVVDFGRPEVQQWARELLDRYIRAYGLKYIRWDFNIEPLAYWDAHDKPGRRGISQLRHVQGFYSVVDWIREHHPDVLLDNCAAGGRRIDLETARRFHTNWMDDWPVDPTIIQFTLFGANQFLPGNYHYVSYGLPTYQRDFTSKDFNFQSLFGGAFGISDRVDVWPESLVQMARVHVDAWKELRRYLVEDFYPLSDQPRDAESWSGWQFHDPADQSGFLQAFRMKTSDAVHRFPLHKLDPRVVYRFTDVYSKKAFEVTGAKAMTEGLEFNLAPMSSRVFTYKKVSE